jgi:hypothetical protein
MILIKIHRHQGMGSEKLLHHHQGMDAMIQSNADA